MAANGPPVMHTPSSAGPAGPWLAAICVALAATLALPGCSGDAPPPNLLLISIDTLRADHLQAYGYERPTAPHLARLAQQGALFEQCFAAANWTLPTHCTLFTGLLPTTHGVETPNDRLAEVRPTLGQALRQAGYRTAGFVANPFLDERFGYAKGFDEYRLTVPVRYEKKGQPRGSVSGVRPRIPGPRTKDYFVDQTSDAVTEAGLAFLDGLPREPGRPFFLFLHFNDVHSDYIPPEPYDRLFDPDYEGSLDPEGYPHNPAITPDMDPRDLAWLQARYDGEIRWVDEHIGNVLADLEQRGLANNTLVVVTADHGEGFFEHKHKEHHYGLYQELVHVPLLLRWPGALPPGRRVKAPISQADITPTLLSLLGLPALPDADGVSRAAALTGPSPAARQPRRDANRPVFVPGATGPILSRGILYPEKGEKRTLVTALRNDRYTVHARHRADQPGTRYEVFDRLMDPDERDPLPPDHPAWTPAVEQLRDWIQRLADRTGEKPAADSLPDDPELIERMRQWGYIR